jgi:cell division protein FtsN
MKYFINICLFGALFSLFPAVFAVAQDQGRAEAVEYYANTEIQAVRTADTAPMPPSRIVIPQNPPSFNAPQKIIGLVSVIPIKVTPGIPDPKSTKNYRVQVGSFSNTDLAWRCYDRLKLAGLNPAFEPHGRMYRVVISGIRATSIPDLIQRLESTGFREAWIRVEN